MKGKEEKEKGERKRKLRVHAGVRRCSRWALSLSSALSLSLCSASLYRLADLLLARQRGAAVGLPTPSALPQRASLSSCTRTECNGEAGGEWTRWASPRLSPR